MLGRPWQYRGWREGSGRLKGRNGTARREGMTGGREDGGMGGKEERNDKKEGSTERKKGGMK